MTQKNTKNGPSFAEVSQRLRECAAEFAEFVIGEKPTYRSGSTIRFYQNQSLVVTIAGRNQGKFYNFGEQEKPGDMLDLYRMIRGVSKQEAFLAGRDYLGEGSFTDNWKPPVKSQKDQEREERESREKRIRVAEWIWKSASLTEGREEGLAYLRNRGITVDIPDSVMRFRVLSPEDLGKMGAAPHQIPKDPVVSVILRATNNKGQTTAVQQILTCNGKKITATIPDFPNPKRTNGDLTGSAIKLGGDRPTEVTLAEGPETGLSVFQVTGKPVWITLGTSNYTTLQLPKSVQKVIVAADLEESGTGIAAALRAAQFWTAAGVPEVGIALPRIKDKKGDFNDALQLPDGEDSIKASFDTVFYSPKNIAPNAVVVTADSRAGFYIWNKTGVEVLVRIPAKRKDGTRAAILLDNVVEDRHTHVLLIERAEFSFEDAYLRKARPDLPIITLSADSKEFLEKAKTPDFVEHLIVEKTSLHAPAGLGTNEALAFCLRRTDADALHAAGHKVVAVRATALDKIDFSFMKDRKAILCPIGNGTEYDDSLERMLKEAGAKTQRVFWQIFAPHEDGFKIVRGSIPKTYGAAEAVAEGWKGEKMIDLVKISEANWAQTGPKDKDESDDSTEN